VADDVSITAGSGTPVATDDCTSAHVQIFKLAYGANGDRTHVPADADGLLVNLGTNNDVTVTSGSITANAGTNLNTSALALEAGGNLAGAAASLAVIDDWDESDRAKVNPIVGQAGLQGGSGAVSANTLRVVLSTDVALPAGTNGIGKLTANSGVDIGDVDVTSISAGSNLIGDVDIQPRTTGGWTPFNANSGDGFTALTNSAQAVKASAGKVGGYIIYNPNTVVSYVVLYNVAAASVTVGTTGARFIVPVPPQALAHIEFTAGIPFDTAIAVAAATTAAGNSAPTSALDAVILYK
jgi:hypothetical protein